MSTATLTLEVSVLAVAAKVVYGLVLVKGSANHTTVSRCRHCDGEVVMYIEPMAI